jgi:hypothetical protein
MWLATIDVRRVSPAIKEKLTAYQLEAAAALSRHFYGSLAAQPALPDKDPLLAQIEALAEMRRRQLEHEERLAAAESKASSAEAIAVSAEAKADAALAGASGDTGFMTLMGFCKIHRLHLTRSEMAQAGLELRQACLRAGIPLRSVPHETYGSVRLWPVWLLEEWAGYAAKV